MSNPKFKPGSRPRETQSCTYSRGYVRQDVYARPLCTVPGASAGFCVGCKAACHGEHLEEVIDMYSKRAFRCDCGNSTMRNTCKYIKKDAVNEKNRYNHNFNGKYCRCKREQDAEPGEMFQCILCEDWYHEKCLRISQSVALADVVCELVCSGCSDNVPVLDAYHARFGLFRLVSDGGYTNADKESKDMPPATDVCVRPAASAAHNEALLGMDRLWTPGFRRKLCRCTSCREEYARLRVPYLIDPADFVNQYEEEEESEESEEASSSGEEEDTPKRQTLPAPAPTLSAAEKRRIRSCVDAFLKKEASKSRGEFDPQVIKNFISGVRAEILKSKT